METRIFDINMVWSSLPALLEYLDVTLLVAVSSVMLGSGLGLALAWGRLSSIRLLEWASRLYVYIMRCTPSIVLLFIVFYGLPELVNAVFDYHIDDMPRAFFAILTFTLLFGAYISEIFRAAYLAVPKGQFEAAVSIGMSSWSAFLHVMLPQAALIALPNFGNSVISLLKEGALAYTIGLIDMLGSGTLIIAQNFGAYGIEVYLACMLIYWGLTSALEQGFRLLEQHLGKGRNSMQPVENKTYFWQKWLKQNKGEEEDGTGYRVHAGNI